MVQPVLNLLRFKKSLHEEMKVTNVKVMHDVKGESKIHSHHSHGKIQAKGSSERLNQSFEVLLLLYFLWCSAFWLKAMHSGLKWCIQELVLAYILKKKQIMLVGCSSVCVFPSFRCHKFCVSTNKTMFQKL